VRLSRPLRKACRRATGAIVEDEQGALEEFENVVFACNANRTLMMLNKLPLLNRYMLSSTRCASE